MKKFFGGLLALGLLANAHAGDVHCYTVTNYLDDYGRTMTVANDTIVGGDQFSSTWNNTFLPFLSEKCKVAAASYSNVGLPYGPLPGWTQDTVNAYLGFGDSINSILQAGNYVDMGVVLVVRH